MKKFALALVLGCAINISAYSNNSNFDNFINEYGCVELDSKLNSFVDDLLIEHGYYLDDLSDDQKIWYADAIVTFRNKPCYKLFDEYMSDEGKLIRLKVDDNDVATRLDSILSLIKKSDNQDELRILRVNLSVELDFLKIREEQNIKGSKKRIVYYNKHPDEYSEENKNQCEKLIVDSEKFIEAIEKIQEKNKEMLYGLSGLK